MNKSFDINKWACESFDAFSKSYKSLLFPLLFLYILGWGKWMIWAFFENKTLLISLYLIAFYLYGCLFYRCLRYLDKNKCDAIKRYINFKKYLSYFLTELMVSIIFTIGLLLFIVPGFIFALKFSLARIIVLEQEKNVFAALKESYRLTTGRTISLTILIVPAIAMWSIGRLAGYSLSGIPTGDTNLFLILFSSCLGVVSCFFILPLTCMALSKAYFMLSYNQGEFKGSDTFEKQGQAL